MSRRSDLPPFPPLVEMFHERVGPPPARVELEHAHMLLKVVEGEGFTPPILATLEYLSRHYDWSPEARKLIQQVLREEGLVRKRPRPPFPPLVEMFQELVGPPPAHVELEQAHRLLKVVEGEGFTPPILATLHYLLHHYDWSPEAGELIQQVLEQEGPPREGPTREHPATEHPATEHPATEHPATEHPTRGFQLGTSANLLLGYNPAWQPDEPKGSPFFPSQHPALKTEPIDIAEPPGTWEEGATVTLHRSVEDMLSTLLALDVLDDDVPSGSLFVGDADRSQALSQLGEWLGLKLDPALNYALIRIARTDGKSTYKAVAQDVFDGRFTPQRFMEPGLRKEFSAVPTPEVVTPDFWQGPITEDRGGTEVLTLPIAQAALKTANTGGTHYVAEAAVGELIVQVYAYDDAHFEEVEKAFAKHPNELKGMLAVAFEYYTTPVQEEYGFTAGQGKVLSFANPGVLSHDVAAGKWSKSKNMPGKPNIFSAFVVSGGPDLSDYTDATVVSVGLRSMAEWIDLPRRGMWLETVRAGLYQKFGPWVQPKFVRYTSPDYTKIYPSNDTGLSSALCTPKISVYKTRLDLSEVQLAFPEIVTDLQLLTNVLRVPPSKEPHKIPGSSKVTLVSHVFDVGSDGHAPPTIECDASVISSLTIACQDFNGPALFTGGQTRYFVLNGIQFAEMESEDHAGRKAVVAVRDVRTAPKPALLEALEYDLSISLTACQSLLDAAVTTKRRAEEEQYEHTTAQRVIQRYLNWVGQAIPSSSSNLELLGLRAQALYMARVAGSLVLQGVHVPYFKYETYQPMVSSILGVLETVATDLQSYQNQIRQRKFEELLIKDISKLNENIISTGKLLQGFIEDTSQQQKDMAGYYESLLDSKRAQLTSKLAEVDKLSQALEEQRRVVRNKVEEYKDAVSRWAEMELVKFTLDVSLTIFTAGATFVAPAGAAKVADLATQINRAVAVFRALNGIFKSLLQGEKDLQAANAVLDEQTDLGVTLPTSEEWSEFGINLQAGLDKGPSLPAKVDLSAALKILVLRGQALLTAQGSVQQVSGEIYQYEKQKGVSAKQQKRLAELGKQLKVKDVSKLDRQRVDLLGLTTSMLFVQRHMQAMVVQSLDLQNEAIQYQYLGSPPALGQVDLLSLKLAMVEQQKAILEGITRIQPPPAPLSDPVVVEVPGVSADALSAGAAFKFSLNLSEQAFMRYAMVRVRRVIARIRGVKSTDSGKMIVDLRFGGTPFEDRGNARQPLTFHTQERSFNYLYDVATGKAEFSDGTGGWDHKVNDITPFSDWTVSLPDSETNQGIEFEGLSVDIELSFEVTALLRDPPFLLGDPRKALLASTWGPPSAPALMKTMHNSGSVLRGWDAVLSMSEDKVNKILADQYAERKSNPDFFYKIPEQEVWHKYPTGAYTVTKFALTLGTPKVQFVPNAPGSTKLTFEIESGTYAYGTAEKKGGKVTWLQPPTKVDSGQLLATVPLAESTGSVAHQKNVILNLESGSFSNKIKVTSGNPTFNDAVTQYMQKASPSFLINTIDLSNKSTLPALTPTSFALNTTAAGKVNIVQVFMTTNGKAGVARGLNLTYPIPEGRSASLLISSKIAFEDVFVKSFDGDFKMGAVKGDKEAYSAKVTSGSLPFTVKATQNVRIRGNHVRVYFDGMTFKSQGTGEVQAHLSKTEKQNFEYWYNPPPPPCGVSEGYWTDASVPVTYTASFQITLAIGGKSGNQTLQLQSGVSSPDITAKLDSSGPCKTNDRAVQEELESRIQKEVPKPLKEKLDVKFSSVSLFALQNLLFPAKNHLDFKAAGIPADLAIFGEVDS